MGRVACSWSSDSGRAGAFSVLLWHWGEMLSFTVLFYSYVFFSSQTREILFYKLGNNHFFSSYFCVSLVYILPDLCIGLLSVLSIVS